MPEPSDTPAGSPGPYAAARGSGGGGRDLPSGQGLAQTPEASPPPPGERPGNRHFVQISASAGSGKTYTLTRRFLDLLQGAAPLASYSGCAASCPEQGYALAEILAATFTNKAAAEMKSRIVGSLKSAALAERAARSARANAPADPGAASKTGATGGGRSAEAWVTAILRHYNSLNIRTIDSLLVTLVRLSALQLDLHPDFEPSFAHEAYFTPHYDALMDDLARDAERSAPPHSGLPWGEISQSLPEDGAPGSPVFYITDGAGLRAGLEEACRTLVLHAEIKGFTPRGRLHDALHDLVARLLTGQELPLMDAVALKKRLHLLHGNLRKAAATMLECIATEQLAAAKTFLNFLQRCAGGASAFAAPPVSAHIQKAALDENLNKASKGAASGNAEAIFARLQKSYADFARALPLLKHALRLAPLVVLAHELHARMQAGRNDSPLLPAIRLPMLAGQALGGEFGVSDALCRLGSRLTHILLDEFQDTSREQWAAIQPLVLESLAQGGTFTYVGDVKQAIYSWRGGESRLFDAAVRDEELLAVAPHPTLENLPYNWRSHPNIVGHNNAFFSLLRNPDIARQTLAAMLPEHTPAPYLEAGAQEAARIFSGAEQCIPPERARKYSVQSEPADRSEPGPAHTPEELSARCPEQTGCDVFPPAADTTGRVCLYTVEGPDNAEVEALLRPRLERLLLEDILPGRRFRDIAVLVRSGEEASLMAEWLSAWRLPVVTENSFLPAEHPLIRRLVAFLTFLDYPLDDLAFWEFVSGPECFGRASGLSPEQLADWLAGTVRAYPRKRPPLYQLFRRTFPLLWQIWIAPFHSRAGLMSVYDLLVEIIRRYKLEQAPPEGAEHTRKDAPDSVPGRLSATGRSAPYTAARGFSPEAAPGALSDPAYSPPAEPSPSRQTPFLRRFLEVAHLAETRGLSSLASFLAFWKNSGEDEKLPLPESMDAIRIMTIHKAKGLEFPVVVLPFHHRGKRHEPGLALAVVDGLTLLTKAGRELESVYYPACITGELERLNLLYVAWTRPTSELHAFITRPESSARISPLARGLSVLLERYAAAFPSLCRWERVEPPASEAEAPAPEAPPGTPLARPATPGSEVAPRPEAAPDMPPGASHGASPAASPGASLAAPLAMPPTSPSGLFAPALPTTQQSAQEEGGKQREGEEWRPMEWLPRLKIYRTSLDDTEFTPARRGILAHLCLEHLALARPGAAAPPGETPAQDVERAVRLGMRLFPLPLADPERVALDMEQSLLWFSALPQAPLWLERGLREQSLLDARGAVHRVDLLVEAGDHLLAVDYKTGRAHEDYHAQVARYMRLLTAAQPLPVRGLLVYLDERRLEEVCL